MANNIESADEDHLNYSDKTPMRPGAHDLSDEQKIEKIQGNFAEILDTLGLDLSDDSLKKYPSSCCQNVCGGNI